MSTNQRFLYTLHLADNTLILAQRNSEWTGHGPVLEQDIAITNIALDLLGQARNFYQYAATIYNESSAEEKDALEKYVPRLWKTYNRELQEDDLAFLRDENQYLNVLLAELPRGDWAFTVLRQFFMSTYQHFLYEQLQQTEDTHLAAIGEKSSKEVAYHLRWSAEWVIRLGDGTEESANRIRAALSDQWMFTGELFAPAAYEKENTFSMELLKALSMQKITSVFEEAGLEMPKQTWAQSGGKEGRHTEHLGYLLAEMQYLQRAYPNATW
ncbi:phenylacetate-CoA oxygenase subunit PaaC [Flavisolibacter sp. BT320]|nr:phenylacetate-CoA oxygenase subunit PaaC [Flavisolibacter longurius]